MWRGCGTSVAKAARDTKTLAYLHFLRFVPSQAVLILLTKAYLFQGPQSFGAFQHKNVSRHKWINQSISLALCSYISKEWVPRRDCLGHLLKTLKQTFFMWQTACWGNENYVPSFEVHLVCPWVWWNPPQPLNGSTHRMTRWPSPCSPQSSHWPWTWAALWWECSQRWCQTPETVCREQNANRAGCYKPRTHAWAHDVCRLSP